LRLGLLVLLVTAGAAIAQVPPPERTLDRTYWIVLAGGQRIPALGELELRPPVVLFRALNGVLQSVRLELVDDEATRAANRAASPRAARNVEIATPPMPLLRLPTAAARVGSVGEAAKRAGQTGTFTDLSSRAPAAAEERDPTRKRSAGDSGP
jgi:hypothetical protein